MTERAHQADWPHELIEGLRHNVDRAEEELAEAEAERDRYKAERDEWLDMFGALQERAAQMEAALEEIAYPQHWSRMPGLYHRLKAARALASRALNGSSAPPT